MRIRTCPDIASPIRVNPPVKPKFPMPPSTNPAKDRLILRLLMTLIGGVFIVMGVVTIGEQHYYGESTRRGYVQLVLDGWQAVGMGVFQLGLGALPLSVWAPNKTWVLRCALLAVAVMAAGLYGSLTLK